MAHFAQLNEDNIVVNTVKVDNENVTDETGNEVEQIGIDHLTSIFPDTHWVQYSYNSNFRINPAAIGGEYDPVEDCFIEPKPPMFNSWVLDAVTKKWKPPVDKPHSDVAIEWFEDAQEWREIVISPLMIWDTDTQMVRAKTLDELNVSSDEEAHELYNFTK